jgi:P4 family phage/plasmid primase-like protien
MGGNPSSKIARTFAEKLDREGYLWVEEIGTWLYPNKDGTCSPAKENKMMKKCFSYMSGQRESEGFTESMLKGTFRMATMLQESNTERLNETHLVFEDGKLNCFTFEFRKFADVWGENTSYSEGDEVIFEGREYTAQCHIEPCATPPSANLTVWKPKNVYKELALLKIPMTYEEALNGKDDQCPKWIQFLNHVFVKEDKVTASEELIDIVGLMCGYILMPHLLANKIFLLAGPTASNGKSTFLKIIKSVIPKGFVAELKFKEFASVSGQNYSKIQLPGKKLIICNEESSKGIDSGLLKEFSDGMSEIQARRLYHDPFSFRFNSTIIAAFNTPPEFDRVDSGVIRRLVYIPCFAEFDGSKHINSVVNPIMKEKKEILGWMVRQAKRLHSLNWIIDDSAEIMNNAKETLLIEQNSALTFTKKYYEPNENAVGYPIIDIYNEYIAWCAKNGFKNPFSSRSFGQICHRNILGQSYSKSGERYRRCRKKMYDEIAQEKMEI